MKSIRTRTIFLIMFLLIGSNLQRIIPPAPVRKYKFSPPNANPSRRPGPSHTF
ncbi:hypothetical protein MKW98_002947 [Papaver atlanticum]|uniref:Uncharacterized protein n=1 Tax=Papaver atlanticum TaxID=357466 RepID=A0AAD4T314_9MAGN|nr:hypothetical protein MKW98_002947 [Papaver atlanticum]